MVKATAEKLKIVEENDLRLSDYELKRRKSQAVQFYKPAGVGEL